MMKCKFITALVAMMGLSLGAEAAVDNVSNFRVLNAIVTADGTFGGCAMRINTAIDATGLNCPSRWVSFSCTGDFNATTDAYKMFDLVQMAEFMGKDVTLTVNDAQKHNGHCVVNAVTLSDR